MTGLLPERKLVSEHLGRVLVLGRGVTGRAVLDYLEPLIGGRVDSITVAEGDDPIEGRYDLCIASPGISEFSDIYQAALAASDELIGEVELAWRESAAGSLWIAITGTNGKTTTTALTAHLMEAAGYDVRCVGNIGDAAITAVGADMGAEDAGAPCSNGPDSHGSASGASGSCGTARETPASPASPLVYVVECSSYQLASTTRFAPDVAVVLNITPDHLAWHQTHGNYADAKWKVLANLRGTAVLNAADDEVRAKVREVKADPARAFGYIPLGTKRGIGGDMRQACGAENAAFKRDDGALVVAFDGAEHALCHAADLQLAGEHNVENALAAASAAIAAGADAASVAEALTAFAPLPHRIEPAGTVVGVRFYNDSKATNTDATLKAITAFLPEKPIILLGGRDKGTDLQDLVDACIASSAGVILYGESLPRFAEAFDGVGQLAADAREMASMLQSGATLPVLHAKGMADAFDAALEAAQPGSIVLLSPACASFDEFSCFEERGDRFKEMVESARSRLGE